MSLLDGDTLARRVADGTLGRLAAAGTYNARKRLGTRWASRTSNPVSGSRQAGGGFDSHTLPPTRCLDEWRKTEKARQRQSAPGDARPGAGAARPFGSCRWWRLSRSPWGWGIWLIGPRPTFPGPGIPTRAIVTSRPSPIPTSPTIPI